jgi:hypothetical protein
VSNRFLITVLMLSSAFCYASVESSLMALQSLLFTRILPVVGVMSLGFAAFQFFVGNPHAKHYLWWAVIGCVILFGAQSIVDLVSRAVQ